MAPRVEKVEEPALAGEVKQPEVIKEKKVEEAPAPTGKDAKGGAKAAPAAKAPAKK
jgi:hypothetical protein